MRQTVTSRQNASVKLAASLHQKKYRDETGLIWLEGERNLSALPEDVKVRFWVSTEPDSLQEKENVIVVEPSIFGYISGLKTPQGMGAVLERPPEEDISSLTEGNILFLERVQNPDNVGAIIRSAACAGFSHVVLSEGCADCWSPKALRACAGNIFRVGISRSDLSGLARLKETGLKLAGAHLSGHEAFEASPGRWALLIGNEGRGLSDEAAGMCDKLVRIPMREGCESLNAACAATVLMYKIMGY
ncbi:MAG: RNA methyltransferase [Eubacteriaceae bacterium]|nr:RNA methyltransferase [Eubacteriaceae bacterium]